jgi:Flp pilus assembly protein TadG
MRTAAARDRQRRAAQPHAAFWARWRDDRGDTSIQMVIVLPFIILFAMLIAQASMWYYAREVAQTAAREGVSAGRTYHSSIDAGTSRAREVASQIGGNSLLGIGVSPSGSSADRITITVSGHAPSVIPGMTGPSISQSASGPRENWRRP